MISLVLHGIAHMVNQVHLNMGILPGLGRFQFLKFQFGSVTVVIPRFQFSFEFTYLPKNLFVAIALLFEEMS